MTGRPGPLTLGTAGHIDHGKTALVRALTGVDTDRLPEERRRGISIALGYAALELASGRRLSVVDVPGHERFVTTMVAGATGIDLYLMVVAADDAVMPQTIEHAAVLRALGVSTGVVAITKADLADPEPAARAARALLPGAAAVIACSARTGAGLGELLAALDTLCAGLRTRADDPAAPLLHIDRVFTVAGFGTVVTGTLWSGRLGVGDRLTLLPGERPVRVRGLQVHDAPCPTAEAGQRVAVNLAAVRRGEVRRGDVLTVPGRVWETTTLDCRLTLSPDTRHGERVQVHHGTRDAAGRLSKLTDRLWQVRLEKPLLAADGDRIVIRRLAPPDTLGGGEILDARAPRHGRRPELIAALQARAAGAPTPPNRPPATPPAPARPARAAGPDGPAARAAAPTSAAALARVGDALSAAGLGLLNAAALEPEDRRALAELCARGSAVRLSGHLHAAAEAVAAAEAAILAAIAARGSISLAETRDLIGSGRKSAQALLEHLDRDGHTRRGPDDRRVARTRPGATMDA